MLLNIGATNLHTKLGRGEAIAKTSKNETRISGQKWSDSYVLTPRSGIHELRTLTQMSILGKQIRAIYRASTEPSLPSTRTTRTCSTIAR
jgi:hypothetical protein